MWGVPMFLSTPWGVDVSGFRLAVVGALRPAGGVRRPFPCGPVQATSWFLVEGSVFEHAVDHVAAPTREADDGGVVVFALFRVCACNRPRRRVFGGCDERGLPQRVLEAFVAPPGGPFAFDAGAGLAGDGRYARVGGQMGGRFEVGDVAADARAGCCLRSMTLSRASTSGP